MSQTTRQGETLEALPDSDQASTQCTGNALPLEDPVFSGGGRLNLRCLLRRVPHNPLGADSCSCKGVLKDVCATRHRVLLGVQLSSCDVEALQLHLWFRRDSASNVLS